MSANSPFTTVDICAEVGISYRQLDYWLRCGYIPNQAPAPGSGNPRSYTVEDVAAVKMLATLVKAGIKVDKAAAIVGQMVNGCVQLSDSVMLTVTA